MKRKVGVSAIHNRNQEKEKYAAVGKNLEENKISFVVDVMDKFKASLSDFATKYKDRINSDPEFRQQFHKMCLSVGVDPLASNKGFWANILGVGDFYYELGVKIIQISMHTRSSNGGMISLKELLNRLNHQGQYAPAQTTSAGKKLPSTNSQPQQKVSKDDVLRAIEKISILGNGFQIINMGHQKMILSVPMEVNPDFMTLLSIAQQYQGMITKTIITSSPYSWTKERFSLNLQPLLTEGVVWLDRDEHGGESYFYPSVWKQCMIESIYPDDTMSELSDDR